MFCDSRAANCQGQVVRAAHRSVRDFAAIDPPECRGHGFGVIQSTGPRDPAEIVLRQIPNGDCHDDR